MQHLLEDFSNFAFKLVSIEIKAIGVRDKRWL